MCTDRTLRNHISKYLDISAQIKKLEAMKKAESEYIMAELTDRKKDEWENAKIVSQTRESADVKRMKTVYPDVWADVRKTSSYKYVRVKEA